MTMPGEPELDDELELEELELEHDWPQIDTTSPRQTLSHAVVQQYESFAQMEAAQGSQLDVS
jgi:hypothetical protein